VRKWAPRISSCNDLCTPPDQLNAPVN
jgi:hypothetical protein